MGDDEKVRTSSRRAGPARALDESTIKGIIEKAIKDLATKEYMDELIADLEGKLISLITEKIELATTPLVDRIDTLENKLDLCESTITEKIELATKPMIDRIVTLENKLALYEAHMQELEVLIDNSEQYSRRSCLRIYGVQAPDAGTRESPSDCMKIVQEIFKEMQVTIPESEIDRTHRVGQKKQVNGKTEQAIIVKFKSWNSRVAAYRGRKKLSKGKSVLLDLTVRRAKLLSKAKEMTKNFSEIEFAFADLNCRLGLKTKSGEFKFFNTEEELLDLV